MITMLKNAAEKSYEAKKELAIAREQNIDITNFVNNVANFRSSFFQTMEYANNKREEAITQIDNAIRGLENAKEALRIFNGHFNTMDNKLEKFTVERLIKNNPTMIELFNKLEE